MLKVVRFNETKDVPNGYGIFVGEADGKTKLTGVVYEADGSMDEPAQLLIIPSSAVAKEMNVRENAFDPLYTSPKFSRNITRNYIQHLKGA